ncbi:S8/S53 family peptidase [Paenibacillus sp. OAS669]|uniref:S8/S53 family peptidase n=1 Tax=Paenibacillus sp. OAS669 TaxID=2663821 RepID=UPI00178A75D3|nr:S8/S53 family peptidase [Paenibacillus sp. OAS669]MBE1442582.1 serine protease AprX [Paenibacillus sp. OAS669]
MVQVPEPIWKRIGLPSPPNYQTAGQGIGIIILDEITPNSLVSHLGNRLIQVCVDDNFLVTYQEPAMLPEIPLTRSTEHGMMVLQLLSHPPLIKENIIYAGLAPAATFIFLSTTSPEKMEAGLNWIMQRKGKWNIKILLNLFVPDTTDIGAMRPTNQDLRVKAIQSCIDESVLVVAANGNSKAHNNLHPLSFFTIGGYDDQGKSDSQYHRPHPSVPVGLNGDGHFRPDLVAPFTFLPVPLHKREASNAAFSYFGGSCGSAAIVAGLCASMLSNFKEMDVRDLRKTLTDSGELLTQNVPLRKLNALKAMMNLQRDAGLLDKNDIYDGTIDRAVGLTRLIDDHEIKREDLKEILKDPSPVIRKVAIYGLGKPKNEEERNAYWYRFWDSPKDTGESILWLNHLLIGADRNELEKWINLLQCSLADVTIVVNQYLERFYPDAPKIQIGSDLNIFDCDLKEVYRWYDAFVKAKK